MRLRAAAPLILASTLVISLVAIACAGSVDSIVQTTTAQQKADNRTATAVVLISRGIDPDSVAVQVGVGSLAEQVVQTQAAERATREAGGQSGSEEALVELPNGEFVTASQATMVAETGTENQALVAPDGPAESGEVTVEIRSTGAMFPAVIKITPGTTVVWVNTERTGHSTQSDPGLAEQWDSGSLARGPLDRENKTFSHTFTIPGRYPYGSRVFGDSSEGTVFVVDE